MDSDTQRKLTRHLTDKEIEKIVPDPKSLSELAEARIEERKLEAEAPTTGYKLLDEKIKGWIPGHVYVFTGETNAGKTAACCNFAYRTAMQAKRVLYFALEPDVSVIEYVASIYHKKLWNQISDDDLDVYLPTMKVYTKETHKTLDKLLNTIERSERYDLIIVDHIGYFTNNAKDRRSQVQQESDAVKRIVGSAKKKKSAIMLIAHPRKGQGKNKKNDPLEMNDISGSAAFKQDATDVLILHRLKDKEDEFRLTNLDDGFILIPKAKTGTSGSVKIRFVSNSSIMLDESEFKNTDYGQAVEGKTEQQTLEDIEF